MEVQWLREVVWTDGYHAQALEDAVGTEPRERGCSRMVSMMK